MAIQQEFRGLALAVATGVVGIAAALTLGHTSKSSREDEAVAKAQRQKAAGSPAAALTTLMDCVHFVEGACRCGDAAGELAIDLNRPGDALVGLKRAKGCPGPRHIGGLAEALVAVGQIDNGRVVADGALAQDPGEPHACFAKAWALSASGPSPEALDLAEKAVRGGRGVPALLLLTTLRSAAKDPAGARRAIDQAVRLAPDDPKVQYDLGVLAQSAHDYNTARTAYLRALAIDPKLADARYNLAELTHSVGANDEAAHHVDELAKISPNDPRVPALRAKLAAPPK